VAQGYGTLTLGPHEVMKLNNVEPTRGSVVACLGAGTGLGECFLTSDPTGEYKCYPSEGGHVEFPPRGQGNDEEQINLLKFLKIKFSGWNRISIERVVSGTGICNVYEFLAHSNPEKIDKHVHAQFLKSRAGDASVIANNAWPGSLCEHALRIFASCYGAQAGSVAIHFMPFGGLYLTGGVTKRQAEWMIRDGSFMEAYKDKGRVSPLLEQVPLYVVKSDDMGQRGAHLRAVRLLKQELSGQGPRTEQWMEVNKNVLAPPREELHVDDSILLIREMAIKSSNDSMTADEGMEGYEPVFAGQLWRLPRDADRLNKADWLERKFWLSKKGSLVYTSKLSGRNLTYWTGYDLKNAIVKKVPDMDSSMPWTFSIQPVMADGTELSRRDFAAPSEELRDLWISALKDLQN